MRSFSHSSVCKLNGINSVILIYCSQNLLFKSTVQRWFVQLLCSGEKYSIHVDLNMNNVTVRALGDDGQKLNQETLP